MGAQLRVYKQKISSAQTTKKITKAMELIAASRIQKAMARVRASSPFARAVTRAVSAVATYSNVDHPLTREPETIWRATGRHPYGSRPRIPLHPRGDDPAAGKCRFGGFHPPATRSSRRTALDRHSAFPTTRHVA